ncbi:hypothetical protein J31TS4_20540 [Paenibacillus sp. J31TS4]|nr:hypothetical protein J31TS4_20540 [Paenibacillus sp. J31TS4]
MAGAATAFVLAKLKALLPLFKVGTLGGAVVTMAFSVWTYTLIAPLEVAVGLVLLLLIHELGHAWAARVKGLPTTAPVFIPFLGAIINMRRHPRDAATEAYIAMGGPLVGSAGAAAAWWIGLQWKSPLFIAMAYIGCLLNLFNLLPIRPLDGGRIVIAVSRWLWGLGLLAGLGLILYTRSFLLLLLWALFAYELYRKLRIRRGKGKLFTTSASYEIPIKQLEAEGVELPGLQHRQPLDFSTFSELDGKQRVIVIWEKMGLRGRLTLPRQGLIRRARLSHVDYRSREYGRFLVLRCTVEYEPYENDAYYDVPFRSRLAFGAVYAGLAAFLVWMLLLLNRLTETLPPKG